MEDKQFLLCNISIFIKPTLLLLSLYLADVVRSNSKRGDFVFLYQSCSSVHTLKQNCNLHETGAYLFLRTTTVEGQSSSVTISWWDNLHACTFRFIRINSMDTDPKQINKQNPLQTTEWMIFSLNCGIKFRESISLSLNQVVRSRYAEKTINFRETTQLLPTSHEEKTICALGQNTVRSPSSGLLIRK